MGCFSRREFIKKAGAGTCVALMAPHSIGCDGDDDGDGESADKDSDGHGDKSTDSGNDTEVLEPQPATVYAVMGNALSELYEMSKQATSQLGIVGTSMVGATVFIKPNLVSMMTGKEVYDPAIGECVKAEIIAGVAEQCLSAGAAKVTIAEGAQRRSWDWNTITFFDGNTIGTATNLFQAVSLLKATYGDEKIELICLNDVEKWSLIPSSSSASIMNDGLLVAEQFRDADHAISLSCLKTHEYGQMTSALKNYVGITPLNEYGTGMLVRNYLHTAYLETTVGQVENAGIAGAYLDMYKWRKEEKKEDFTIVDCSIGMEATGPHLAPLNDGKTIDFKARSNAGRYFLLASTDLVAADAVGAQIVKFNIDDVKQLNIAKNLGLGQTALDKITVAGAALTDLLVPDWEPPVPTGEDFFLNFGNTES